jgi:hypothetical protein
MDKVAPQNTLAWLALPVHALFTLFVTRVVIFFLPITHMYGPLAHAGF